MAGTLAAGLMVTVPMAQEADAAETEGHVTAAAARAAEPAPQILGLSNVETNTA